MPVFLALDQSGVSDFALYVIIPIKDNNPSLHSFFYKNLFYKNVEAAIGQNFKNMPRTYPG